MKKILLSFILILTMAAFSASAQNYVVTSVAKQQNAQLDIAETEVVFGVTAATKQIAVKTNTQFVCAVSADWCTASVTGSTINISVTANPNPSRRSTGLTVRGKDGVTKTLNIVQLGTTPEVVATPSKVEIIDDNLQFNIEVASSVEPVFNCPAWISAKNHPKGVGTKVYNFTATSLTDAAERLGKITVSGANAANTSVEIYQYTRQYPSFAVISDVHFGNNVGEGPMVKVPRALKVLSKHKDLDAIFVVGDITNSGEADQYKQLVSVFTDSTNYIHPIDRKVFLTGNHDNYSGNTFNYVDALRVFNDGKDYPYNQYIIIKGYPFITISMHSSANNDDLNAENGPQAYPQAVQDTLKKWLARASKECPGKPIFIFVHVPPKYTCYSTWPGEGEGENAPTWSMKVLNPILNKYPQAVVFSGHSHYPLGDPRSIHQGVNPKSDKKNYYTVVNTGSITYTEIEEPGVENNGYPTGYENVTEGLIVSVQPQGNVELRRYDTKRDEEIHPDQRWILKAPFDGSQFEYADIRDIDDNVNGKPVRDGKPAPIFAESVKIDVTMSDEGVRLEFPQAKDNEMTLRYKLQIINDKGYTVRTAWRYAGDYLNSDMPKNFTYSFRGLEVGKKYTAKAEAYDSYNNVSAPIFSDPFTVTLTEGNSTPACAGRWDFEDDNDLLKCVEGTDRLIPCTLTMDGIVTQKESVAEVNVKRCDGPSDNKKAVTIGQDCAFLLTHPNTEMMGDYTVMWDLRPHPSNGYSALFQADNSNASDADFCTRAASQIGIGSLGYYNVVSPNNWYRVVFTVKNGFPSLYVDGVYMGTSNSDQSGRWKISAGGPLLFSDDDGEVGDRDVAQIAFWDKTLTAEQIYALGSISKGDYINVDLTDVTLADKNSFKLTVSSSVEPSFNCPDWLHVKRPVPSLGKYTYHIDADKMNEAGSRTGEITISGPEASSAAPVKVKVTQTCSSNVIPEAKGRWTFDDDDDFFMNSYDTEFYMSPATIQNPGVTPVSTAEEAGITRVAGPTAENKAIMCPATAGLSLAFDTGTEENITNYTFMFDICLPHINNYCALLQTDPNNSDDCDFCINSSGNIGLNVSGLGYGGQMYEGRWHRIVFVLRDNVSSSYLDGKLLHTSTSPNSRWALSNTGCCLHCDDDGENSDAKFAEIRYWDQPLSDLEVANLGGVDYPYIYINNSEVELADNNSEFSIEVNSTVEPKFELPEWITYVGETPPAAGIHSYSFTAAKMTEVGERKGIITISAVDGSETPAPVSVTVTQKFDGGVIPACTGKWDFEDSDDYFTSAEGNAMLIPYSNNEELTKIDDPTEADFPMVEGPTASDKAISVTADYALRLSLNETENVRDYTLMYDIMIPSLAWETLLQTDLGNINDGDIFIKPNGQIGLGVSSLGYAGNIEAGKWYRIILAVRNGVMNIYVNGRPVINGKNDNDNRWVLDKTGAWIHCDDNKEVTTISLASLRYWNTALSDTQIQTLGSVIP